MKAFVKPEYQTPENCKFELSTQLEFLVQRKREPSLKELLRKPISANIL